MPTQWMIRYFLLLKLIFSFPSGMQKTLYWSITIVGIQNIYILITLSSSLFCFVKITLFIYFWLSGSLLLCGLSSSCREWGLLSSCREWRSLSSCREWGLLSSCREWGLLSSCREWGPSLVVESSSSLVVESGASSCNVWASHCGGFSVEPRLSGMWTSVVVACGLSSCSYWAGEHRLKSCGNGLSCSGAHGIFLDRGSNPHLLPW